VSWAKADREMRRIKIITPKTKRALLRIIAPFFRQLEFHPARSSTALIPPRCQAGKFDTFLNLSHRFFPSFPHFPDGDDGKNLGKNHVEEDEERDTTGKNGPLHPRWRIEHILIGSLGLVSVGTTITNRSSHMPIITEMEAINVPKGVRVLLKLSIGRGITKQKRNIAQK